MHQDQRSLRNPVLLDNFNKLRLKTGHLQPNGPTTTRNVRKFFHKRGTHQTLAAVDKIGNDQLINDKFRFDKVKHSSDLSGIETIYGAERPKTRGDGVGPAVSPGFAISQ